MKMHTTHFAAALRGGVHTTTTRIHTRRNGHQWHAPLATFDADAQAALSAGKVVRNSNQGFDAFPAGPRFINVRLAPSS